VALGGSVDIGFSDILPHADMDSALSCTQISVSLDTPDGGTQAVENPFERFACVLTVPCHHALLRIPFSPSSQGCVPGDFTSLFWRELFHSSLCALLAPTPAEDNCRRHQISETFRRQKTCTLEYAQTMPEEPLLGVRGQPVTPSAPYALSLCY
jgi:hypothetical protein